MKLHINGEEKTFDSAVPTLAALVETLGMKPDRVAVELNREIVPRDRWEGTHLNEGDRLEVVHFVGGGAGPAAFPTSTCISVPTPAPGPLPPCIQPRSGQLPDRVVSRCRRYR
ncbi:MAG TPA: sulfur carrier protein ThiS [Candidatus Dormibacteraeota bacterium]|nr:sulfur carrier protein ThiS [Candidatus Dormibacteraeota bacterium]